jgi:DNA-binding CsgD family transcriptional regulator/GGDEF domain-containing protein
MAKDMARTDAESVSVALPDREALLRFLDSALGDGSNDRVGLLIIEVDGSADVGGERAELLGHVAMRGRRIVRGGDLFCSLDDDVFALAWRQADEAAQAGLVSRVVTAMRAPFVLSACELYLDVVVGTSLSEPTSTAESMLAKAERSLMVMQTARRYGLTPDPQHATTTHGQREPHGVGDAALNGSAATRPRAGHPVPPRAGTLVVDLSDGHVRHIDDPGQRMLAEPRGRLVGEHVAKLVDPSASAGFHLALAGLTSGAIESFRGRCTFLRHGEPIDTWVTVRAISVRNTRLAVWTALPEDEETSPVEIDAPFWHRQVELAVGFVGPDLVVAGAVASAQRVEARDPRLRSSQVTEVLRAGGASLLSFVHVDDADAVRAAHGVALSGHHPTVNDVRWFHPAGGWFDAELIMFATGGSCAAESVGFVLAEHSTAAATDDTDERVMRLERLLAHIAAEARSVAKAAFDGTDDVRSQIDWSRLDGMSNRQREVVKRLVMGERVPAIAKAMFISRSTVRNHLSSAFHLCGVSTQSDLIELFLATAVDQPAA